MVYELSELLLPDGWAQHHNTSWAEGPTACDTSKEANEKCRSTVTSVLSESPLQLTFKGPPPWVVSKRIATVIWRGYRSPFLTTSLNSSGHCHMCLWKCHRNTGLNQEQRRGPCCLLLKQTSDFPKSKVTLTPVTKDWLENYTYFSLNVTCVDT